jgi:3-isopropylmalate/(R)-2-methylmalate dehydratase large subunit
VSTGKTISEKILMHKSGQDIRAGDYVVAEVDFAYSHDANRPLPMTLLKDMGVDRVWNPSNYVLLLDHYPSPTRASATSHQILRKFAAEQKLQLYDVGEGISHVVIAERGHVAPGDLVVASDSHTCTLGALGAFGTGVGSTDLAAVLATGKTWLKVPETIRVDCHGDFQQGVSAKDLALHLAGQLGADGANYMAVEYAGEAITSLGIHGRFTLANMAIEMGAKAGLFASDEITDSWLRIRLDRTYEPVFPDADAAYALVVPIDVSALAPTVALPHSPCQVEEATKLSDVPVQQVVIGTCTAGRLDDLEVVLSILRGRRIAQGVRLYVTPPSRETMAAAMKNGFLQELVAAGANIGTPGCSGCVGGCHYAIPADGENVITTANRNFRGRLGNPEAFMYLSSPATAAASALTGTITDPRDFLRNVS